VDLLYSLVMENIFDDFDIGPQCDELIPDRFLFEDEDDLIEGDIVDGDWEPNEQSDH